MDALNCDTSIAACDSASALPELEISKMNRHNTPPSHAALLLRPNPNTPLLRELITRQLNLRFTIELS